VAAADSTAVEAAVVVVTTDNLRAARWCRRYCIEPMLRELAAPYRVFEVRSGPDLADAEAVPQISAIGAELSASPPRNVRTEHPMSAVSPGEECPWSNPAPCSYR
jgi:hypothetical protein